MGKAMQGVVLPGQDRVELKDFDRPEPGHGQVLVKMKASGLCGSDLRAIYHEHTGAGLNATRTSSRATSRPDRSRPWDRACGVSSLAIGSSSTTSLAVDSARSAAKGS
jgi:hypothetical protein